MAGVLTEIKCLNYMLTLSMEWIVPSSCLELLRIGYIFLICLSRLNNDELS